MKMLTPITFEEASKILDNKPYATVRNGVKTGALKKLPSVGQVQKLAKEQVELFKGMKQIRVSTLPPEKKIEWKRLDTEINALYLNFQNKEKAKDLNSDEKKVITWAETVVAMLISGNMQLVPNEQALYDNIGEYMGEEGKKKVSALLEVYKNALSLHDITLINMSLARLIEIAGNNRSLATYLFTFALIFAHEEGYKLLINDPSKKELPFEMSN